MNHRNSPDQARSTTGGGRAWLLLARERVRAASAHRRPPLTSWLTWTNSPFAQPLTRNQLRARGAFHGAVAWVCFVAPAKPASGVPAAGVLWHMVGTFIAALTPRPGVRTISPEHDGQAHHHRQNHCTGGDGPRVRGRCHLASSSPGRRDRGTPQPLPLVRPGWWERVPGC